MAFKRGCNSLAGFDYIEFGHVYWNCWPFLDNSAHFMYVKFFYKFNIIKCCQAFLDVTPSFKSHFLHAYSYFCGLKHSKSHCFLCQLTKINFGTPMQRYVSINDYWIVIISNRHFHFHLYQMIIKWKWKTPRKITTDV